MGATKEYFEQIQQELTFTHSQVVEGELSNLDGLIKMREAKEKAEEVLSIVKNFEDERLNEITTESDKYGNKYCGFEIKAVNGRKTYSFSMCDEIKALENQKKTAEEKYRLAFEGYQKGVIQTTRLIENDPDSPLGWIDEDGQVLPFPELNIGKSYLTIKKSK